MLKGIDPLLRGELLRLLDEMGHGERFALVDRNFGAYRYGKPVVDLGDVSAGRAAQALFSVFPLDTFCPTPLARMAYDDDSTMVNDAHKEVFHHANASSEASWEWEVLHRPEFYEQVPNVSLVVRCLEDAPYACFMFQKGVI
jgi:L-fucose mutarotase